MKNNPFTVNQTAEESTYDMRMKSFLTDLVICVAIFMALLEEHPMAGASDGKSTKVTKSKVKA